MNLFPLQNYKMQELINIINNLYAIMKTLIGTIISHLVRPIMCEITALGVAIAAGSAEGIKKWDINLSTNVPSDTFIPSITENGIYLKNIKFNHTIAFAIFIV
jgi:glycerol kinase